MDIWKELIIESNNTTERKKGMVFIKNAYYEEHKRK